MKKKDLDISRTITVYITSDYGLLRTIKENRVVIENKKLKDSIIDKGQISPILVDDKYFIIDGQHRKSICEELNIPVEFIIDGRAAKIDTIVDMNVTQKSWNILDYIRSYANSGNNEYIKLLKYIKDNNWLGVTTIIELLKYTNKTGVTKDIKDGTFKIDLVDGKKADFLLAYLKIKKADVEVKLLRNTYFIRACVSLSLLDKFKWTRMSTILKNLTEKDIANLKTTAALKFLFILYNKNINDTSKLVLKNKDMTLLLNLK